MLELVSGLADRHVLSRRDRMTSATGERVR